MNSQEIKKGILSQTTEASKDHVKNELEKLDDYWLLKLREKVDAYKQFTGGNFKLSELKFDKKEEALLVSFSDSFYMVKT